MRFRRPNSMGNSHSLTSDGRLNLEGILLFPEGFVAVGDTCYLLDSNCTYILSTNRSVRCCQKYSPRSTTYTFEIRSLLKVSPKTLITFGDKSLSTISVRVNTILFLNVVHLADYAEVHYRATNTTLHTVGRHSLTVTFDM